MAADRTTGDKLGYSIAIEKNIMVVGAPYDDSSNVSSRSVYVVDVDAVPTLDVTVPMKSLCFSAFNTVFVKGKGFILMHALKVGDLVLSNNGEKSFSSCVSIVMLK